MKIKKTILLTITFLGLSALLLTECKKKEEVTPGSVTGTDPVGSPVDNQLVDTSWTLDKAHCNVQWSSRYYDYSDAMLTGRFGMFGFAKHGTLGYFTFDGNDMSKGKMNAWVQLSSFNTTEGRDYPGGCGRGYLGITYLDSMYALAYSLSNAGMLDSAKKISVVNPASDTARFVATSFVREGNGYVVKGNFTFNRYRAPSGNADGTPITKPVTMYLDYQGTQDFDTNNDGTMDRYRAGFTGTFTFNRSDFMDNASTKAYAPVPTGADAVTNGTSAANNKTYGVWSKSIADEMSVTMNIQAYKKH